VKRRLKALKRLQFESTKVEAKFYEEYHALEMKYQSLYQPFREKVVFQIWIERRD
jgi:nucleosome assembly protein 1-like 1